MTQVTPIQPEQVERLPVVVTNPRDKAFISTLAKTGMRVSEAVQLKESDIDFQRATLIINVKSVAQPS